MSGNYRLVLAKTFACSAGVFYAGKTYTEEQLSAALEATNDVGERYFVPVEDLEETAALQSIGIETETPTPRKKGVTVVRRSEAQNLEPVVI